MWQVNFCNLILPPDLQEYYNDKIDFKNDTALHLGLTSFALINIDEFDSLSRSQQPLLKYLLSKHDVKMRPPYGKAYEQHRRYASFIATTNNRRPLTDPTGSRRFICIWAERINFRTDKRYAINYPQIYAQLKTEILRGDRYWFDDAETARIMQQNAPFQKVDDYVSMIRLFFASPDECKDCQLMLVEDVIRLLEGNYLTFWRTNTANRDIGRTLKEMGYCESAPVWEWPTAFYLYQ